MQSIPDLKHGRRKARIGLRGYIFCCLGLVAALPVLVLGVIQVSKWEAKQLDDVDQERQFVAQTLEQGIGQIVDGHVRAVEALAGQVQTRGSFDKAVLQPMLSSLRARYGGFSVMYIAGADAVSIVTDPPFNEDGKSNAGTNYSSRDYYRVMVRTGKTAISRVQIGKRSGVPNVQIAAPVRDDQGVLRGFVEGSLDLDSIQQLVDSIIRGMPGLQVAVLDHAGRVIAYPDAKLRRAVATLSQLALFKKYTGSGIEIRTGEDDKGVAMRASVTAVTAHGLDWNVVVYRPQVYELSQAAAARTQVLTVAGIALLVGLLVATFLAEGLARPIRKLANIVTAVSKGDLSQMPDPPHALMPREMATLQVDVRHMVGQLKDSTTYMESKIEERTEQVREANRELESYLYSITHDLKAPVISLSGMAAMLQKKCGEQLGEQGTHYLQRLMSNAGFMEQLISDLLNFSRVGKHEYHMVQLEADRVLRESLDQCDSRVREGNIAIKVYSPLPTVVFDRNALCKIFLNLISNGMKFMGDQPQPCIEIGGREVDGYVEYYVKDNGIGIDQKYHDKVFKMFQRLKDVSVDGTGIGLAIVKKIIDIAGGRIWFESEVGRGTTFFFRIPRVDSPQYSGGMYELERVSNG